MTAARPDQHVAGLPVVQSIVARQPEVAGHLGDHSQNGEVAEVLARNPRERRWNVDRAEVVGERHRAIEPDTQLIEHGLRKRALMLHRDIGIARLLVDVRDRRLVRRNPHDVGPVVRRAHEKAVRGRRAVIDAQLKEMLVGRLRLREEVLGSAAAERTTVGAWKQRLEIGGNRRMQRDGTARQNATTRVIVRNGGDPGHAKTLDEPFVRAEKERAIALDRTAEDTAKLMSRELRLGLRSADRRSSAHPAPSCDGTRTPTRYSGSRPIA